MSVGRAQAGAAALPLDDPLDDDPDDPLDDDDDLDEDDPFDDSEEDEESFDEDESLDADELEDFSLDFSPPDFSAEALSPFDSPTDSLPEPTRLSLR